MALPFTAFPALTVDAGGCGSNNEGGWNKWMGHKQRRTDAMPKKNNYDNMKNANNDYDKYDQQYNAWKKDLVCPAPKIGEGARFHSACEIPQGSFVTFVSGLTTVSVQATIVGTVVDVAVPDSISGQSYVFITKSAITGMIMDGDVLAGPAVLEGRLGCFNGLAHANKLIVTPSPPIIDNTTF